MQQADLTENRKYAIRKKDSEDDDPFLKITYLGPCRRKARIRYEEGDLAGLDEWIPTRDIVCPWGERRAVLRDLARGSRLQEADDRTFDRVYEDAISHILTASGEDTGFMRTWATDRGRAERIWSRGKMDGSPLDHDPVNFVDRDGFWHLSFDTATTAAKTFAAEPDLVELYIREWEERLKAEGFQPGNRHSHGTLREFSPGFALARSWCGAPQGSAAEEEIQRLQKLVNQAVYLLRAAGDERGANRVERGAARPIVIRTRA